MISVSIAAAVKREIRTYPKSQLRTILGTGGDYVIKYVQSKWASHYATPRPLKISETPAQTWGTATYVTPLRFPLSSALYGRIGLVTEFNPSSWLVFDATQPAAKNAYIRWAMAQPAYPDLMLTVHSTIANQELRNKFREFFKIDCVLFHPDQEAESHTDSTQHIWMAVTDWTASGGIECGLSNRLARARFTVLIDEDFSIQDQSLPIRVSRRQIESSTEIMHLASPVGPIGVSNARFNSNLPQMIGQIYLNGGYLHVYIEP